MKRAALVALGALFGILVGGLVAASVTAYYPHCGDECGEHVLVVLASWSVGAGAAFGGATWAVTRGSSGGLRAAATAVALLSGVLVVPAAIYYAMQLRHERNALRAATSISPDVDHPFMLIATRTIQARTASDARHASPVYTIKRWERCVTAGEPICDTVPPQLEILCKSGEALTTVYVDEVNWPALTRVPLEDFKFPVGADFPKLEALRACGKHGG